jgi:hypothetical protein
MDEFTKLQEFLNHMVDKTILGVGIINDELVMSFNDGSRMTIFNDEDGDLSLNLIKAN